MDCARKEVRDEESQKKLWQFSEEVILAREKEGAVKVTLAKKLEEEAKEKKEGVNARNGTENEKSASGAAKGQQQTPGSTRSRKGSAK